MPMPRTFLPSFRPLRAILWLAALCLFALRRPAGPARGGDVPKLAAIVMSGDWPMSGYDAKRSASSPADLPRELTRRWELHLPALKPAWPDQPRMPGERVYSPIIIAGRL